jgi:hypothetical protein
MMENTGAPQRKTPPHETPAGETPASKAPPGWIESLLEWMLPAHTREEIVGDLREDYVESILPRRGRVRAIAWYAGHVLSFLPAALRESRIMSRILIFFSGFTTVCMFWLASMEMALQHPGYGMRLANDIAFAVTCLLTAYLRMLNLPHTRSENCLRGAGLLMILFGATAFLGNARAAHFEGFVFIISQLMVVQGLLMLLTLGRKGETHPNLLSK